MAWPLSSVVRSNKMGFSIISIWARLNCHLDVKCEFLDLKNILLELEVEICNIRMHLLTTPDNGFRDNGIRNLTKNGQNVF